MSELVQKRLSRRKILAGIGLLAGTSVAGGLLAACGQAATPTAAPANPTVAPKPAAEATKPAAEPTKPAVAAPTAAAKPTEAAKPAATPAGSSTTQLATNQVFRFNILGEPNTIDPTLAEDTNTSVILPQIFTNLVRYRGDLTIEPAVAESWTVSPDGKSYTFKLKDTKWSDGQPLTAKDFEYSFKRFADPRVASPYANFIYIIKGVEEYNSALGTEEAPKKPSDDELDKLRDAIAVKAVDDKTLQVDLVSPASFFLNIVAHGNLAPLRQDVIEKNADKWTDPDKIVVNGPFTVESWTPKSKIVLKKNPNYFDKASTLNNIELTFITEQATAYAAYQNNELDISFDIPDAQIPQVRQDAKLKPEIYEGTELATYYIGFNNKDKPFSDKKVRQAFQMAVDTKTLCEKVLAGVARPAKSFVPPGMPGHQSEIGFDFDVAKAKQLLADAGYPDGKGFPEVKFVYNTSTGHKLRVEYVQAQIKQNLGIDLAVENWEPKTYFRQVATDHPAMFRVGWIADYPYPNNFLNEVFKTGAGQNYSQYSNKDFDDLNAKAIAETDQAKSLQMFGEAQKLLVDDAPVIWLYWYGRFRLIKPWVKNLTITPMDSYIGSLHWRDIQIAQH